MQGYQHTPLEASWVSRPAQPPFAGSTFPVLIVLQTRIDQRCAFLFEGAE